jgi:hypothetical protein
LDCNSREEYDQEGTPKVEREVQIRGTVHNLVAVGRPGGGDNDVTVFLEEGTKETVLKDWHGVMQMLRPLKD